MILGSGIALGVYVPALSLKLQLQKEGHTAELMCVEELYAGKDEVMEETRKSFHKDFRLAQLSYRLPTRNKTAIDDKAAECFIEKLSDEKYDAVITFSGFWTDLLNRLLEICPYYEGRIFAVHMDASRSLSWKNTDTAGIKELWLYDLNRSSIDCTIEETDVSESKSNRILVHGGGWGIGEYDDKIKKLNDLGYKLDIIIYEEDELIESDRMNDYFLLDPKWKPYKGSKEYPRLLKYQEGKWIEYSKDRSRINPIRELIRQDCAILSKPGGGTIYDSLITGTPLIFSKELAFYEADNRKLWEDKGFGTGFEDFILNDNRDNKLKEMRKKLIEAAGGLPLITDIICSI